MPQDTDTQEAIRRSLPTPGHAPGGDDNTILEIYKMYVETAERVSQRRGAANTFFLSFNTALIGALAGFFDKLDPRIIPPFILAAIVFCVTWWLLLRSYRTLNTAKFQVIGALEEHLPVSPLYRAEWQALGQGRDWSRHVPLTPIERFVPLTFGVIYVLLFILLLTGPPSAG